VRSIPAVQSLLHGVEKGGVLPFPGVAASAQAFLTALLREAFPPRPIVVVTDGLKSQETFQQDLETWLREMRNAECGVRNNNPTQTPDPRPQTLFYPDWEILPHEDKLPHADVISERLETLVAITHHASRITPVTPTIVTNVIALMQRTFAPGALTERTRRLSRGDRANPLDLVEWLEDEGYEPEAQVTQKGEMALRGGILDVFPLTSPWPVRLEFFGDELESLRQFDPQTQMSRDEIESVTLPPAGELGLLKRAQREERGLQPASTPELEAAPKRPEGRAPSLATLVDYLPADAILLLCEPLALEVHANDYSARAEENDPFHTGWSQLLSKALSKGMTIVELSEVEDAALGEDLADGITPHPARGQSLPSSEEGRESAVRDRPQIVPLSSCRRLPAAGSRVDSSRRVRVADPHGRRLEVAGTGLGVGRGEGGSPYLVNPHSALHTPHFQSLDAWRPLADRPPEPQVAETLRREFFQQLHRWLRQGFGVHVFCNNDGERQRFGEVWEELGLGSDIPGLGMNASECATGGIPDPRPQTPDPAPEIRIGALSRGFICEQAKLVVVTDAEVFGRYKVQRPRRLKSPHATAARSLLDINFAELEPGDYVVHLQHGIGRYAGLQNIPAATGRSDSRAPQSEIECLVIEYAPREPDQPPPKLYVPVSEAHLVSKYVGAGKVRPMLNTLGGGRWTKTKEQAEKAVRDLAAELLAVQAARDSLAGHSFGADTPWQREFESAFLYEETPDQLRAISETKGDMERAKPMDRLICGDVGFGKTEVAIRAAFKAVMSGKQVAILVPTTVLAQQHYNNFRERMADYPVRIELLSRFRTRRQQDRVVQDLAKGAVDIVIGTHRLVQEDVAFKDLGLVVIDEEQRFGVLHKEKFKLLRKLVDVLTLSATPIPRTLYLALTGARDMSTIQTPPHDRLPVETVVTQYDERLIRDAIQRELNRGGQVFFLHNRVMTIDLMADKLKTLLPDARIVVGHGQMHADELEEVMTRFVNGEADVLLSTTIIESGLDIPNANTIIIDRADRFGLSELYQLRGRVGRYKHQAYAYLLLPRHARLLTDVRKRMSTMKQYSQLGSGFKIAMRDLEIRGAGNLLGSQQSGHITAVGFELYCQLLKQSIAGLKGEKVKPRVEVTVRLDFLNLNSECETRHTESDKAANRSVDSALRTPHSAILPSSYVPEPQHRIDIYRKLAQATDRESLAALKAELRDRFGPLPRPVELLLLIAELKYLAADRHISVIETKDDRLMLTRHDDYIQLGGKFPRLTKKTPEARLKEIRMLLLAL
jgi:transcription-repair coupling factor (superfamily II helicase)